MCLVFPLIALIGVHMVRMEGRTPILTFLQLITGAATGVLLVMPMLLMTIIPFRPDRSPELTVTLNDISWLLFITPIGPFIIQNIAIGTAILSDRNRTLPRWVGYLNFWVAFLFVPDILAALSPAARSRMERDLRFLASFRCLRGFPCRYGAGLACGHKRLSRHCAGGTGCIPMTFGDFGARSAA